MFAYCYASDFTSSLLSPLLNADNHSSAFFLGTMHVPSPQEWLGLTVHTTLPSPSAFFPFKLGCEDVVSEPHAEGQLPFHAF